MNSNLLKLLGQIRYSKSIPPNLPNEIEKECWEIQTKVDTKALEIPQELKQYAKHTFNQIGRRKNELEEWCFELQRELENGMDNNRLQYIDDQLWLFREIFATLDDLLTVLLEHLIAYFPDVYATEQNKKILKLMHPHSLVLVGTKKTADVKRKPEQKSKQEPEFRDVLSIQITHDKRVDIANAIKAKYSSYKGKDFKILFEAMLELDLFPKKGKRSLYFRCLQNEGYNINSVQMLEDRHFKTGYNNPKGKYEKSQDEIQRDEVIEYLESIIKPN
jgi:hypothetical protein